MVKQVSSGRDGTGYAGTLSLGFVSKHGSEEFVVLRSTHSIERTKCLEDGKLVDLPSNEGKYSLICNFEKLVGGGEEEWGEYMGKKLL